VNPFILLADGPEEVLPFLLGALFFLTPIVAILTRHQQRMAEILRRQPQTAALPEEESRVHAEMAALRQLVAQQSLAIEDLARSQRELNQRLDSESLRDRLHQS
jgi:hypothetical protein